MSPHRADRAGASLTRIFR